MEVRAAIDLAQLSDSKFFEAVSKGLELVLENATRLNDAVHTLAAAKHAQAMRIMKSLVGEEAAKFLILIDAVRCPLTNDGKRLRGRQLGYFSNDLARGIYADLAYAKPINLAELQRYADSAREKFYLDGPNGVDWIFRNRVLAEREDAMYVDYVKTDDGHQWLAHHDPIFLNFNLTPQVLTISQALYQIGMTTPRGLKVVADIWRKIDIHPDLSWDEVEAANRATIEKLGEKGLLADGWERVYGAVVSSWLFPLYALDLSEQKVDPDTLRQQQKNWSPGF